MHFIFAQIESIVDEIIYIIHSYRSRLAERLNLFHLQEAGRSTLHGLLEKNELQVRPRYAVSEEQVISLRCIGFLWVPIKMCITSAIPLQQRVYRR